MQLVARGWYQSRIPRKTVIFDGHGHFNSRKKHKPQNFQLSLGRNRGLAVGAGYQAHV